jgi:vancomycin resistance protein YoaR
MVNNAFFVGRGNGFIPDTISFLQHLIGERMDFDITYELALDALHARVETFVEDYNNRLDASKPIIYADKIVFTKGAGKVHADTTEICELTNVALFESLDTGQPVEIVYTLPESRIDAQALLNAHNSVHIPVQSAELDRETWAVTNCVVGVDFCLLSAVSLLKATESGKTVTIDVEFIQPETTKDYLESRLFRDLIGECTTWVHGDEGRITNVKLSSEAIDGIILEPDEEFSFNDVVGVRSRAKGYSVAGAFVNRRQVYVVGGGICQVSSTIYSAIRDTGLLVTERHPHSRAVPYLPRSRDATVYWGFLDFKFVNNTDYPIRIDIELNDRDLTVRVYGTIVDGFPMFYTDNTE